jgi:hypothetical protein
MVRGPEIMTNSFLFRERTMNRLLSSCLFLTLGAASAACTVAVDSGREQCRANADCAAKGAAYADYVCKDSVCQPDPTWACLDNTSPYVAASGTVRTVFTFQDLLSQQSLPGVHLTLCAKLDADCSMPINQYVSNQDGQITVDMPGTFDGYFQTEGDGIYPSLYFAPNGHQQSAPTVLPVVPASFFGMMFSGLGTAVAPDRTAIMTTALDCLARPASNLTLSASQLDDKSVAYYLKGGLPSGSATATDKDGAGGFVNVKAGNAVVTSMLGGKVVGSVGVQTRPGHLTMVLVLPDNG